MLAHASTTTPIIIDNWYGINGATDPSDPTPGGRVGSDLLPCMRWVTKSGAVTIGKRFTANTIRKSSELAFIYDGVHYNHTLNNAYRVNGRHGGKGLYTNILLFDGHAESYLRSSLPHAVGDYNTIASLSLYPRPKWRTDQ